MVFVDVLGHLVGPPENLERLDQSVDLPELRVLVRCLEESFIGTHEFVPGPNGGSVFW